MQPNPQLTASLRATANKLKSLEDQLASGISPKQAAVIKKEIKRIAPVAELHEKMSAMASEYDYLIASQTTERDPSMLQMLSSEIKRIDADYEQAVEKARVLLLPKDPNDEKNIIVEMRAGVGGDESALFVGDLFNVYKRYCEGQDWRLSVSSSKTTGSGGLSSIIFEIDGDDVYAKMKYESGVHRVQRVPDTEASGRVHTSTITVAVLPEMDDLEVHIEPKDVRIDVMRASGAGGQSVNKTESAVRLTHLPTNIVVYSQEEKSQNENKDKAFKVLRAKLWEKAENERMHELSSLRKGQIGSGDRSEKIRTYNYPQNRFTDHRIGLTINNLSSIMAGNIQPVIDAMQADEQRRMMEDISRG